MLCEYICTYVRTQMILQSVFETMSVYGIAGVVVVTILCRYLHTYVCRYVRTYVLYRHFVRMVQ